MATRASLNPFSAEFPSSNFPQLLMVNGRPALAFSDSTTETCYWTMVVPQGWTGTKTFIITYAMASATTGGVVFDVAVEAISDGDSIDMDSSTSFDTANSANETVPGTAGFPSQLTVTLTNNDSSAAGDYIRFSLARDTADGNDTATGDCYVFVAEVRDGA